MASPEFTSSGLIIQSLAEINAELVAAYQVIYGTDINLDADTPDGQRVGIEAKARSDLQEGVLQLKNNLDPDLSQGLWLDVINKLSGITRVAATQSTVNINVTVSFNLTLPVGYIITDDLNQNWILETATALTVGTTSVGFKSELFGAYEASIGTIVNPQSVILGVTSVTNPAVAIAVIAEETDESLRIRRNNSLENPAYSVVGSLFAGIANLSNVTKVKIYENKTDTYDAVLSLNAHSIWVIVLGGTDQDIFTLIAKEKTGGTGLKGSTSGTYVEQITLGALTFDYTHGVSFDRPTEQPLYINITATRKTTGDAVNITNLKAFLATKTYNMADRAIASVLYEYAYDSGTNFIATDLEISDDDITYVDSSIESAIDGYFTIDVANITVTEVT
jgi:uncharacterized phage protein gp47/JayE